MNFLRQVLRGVFRLLGHVYSYKFHLKVVGFRDALYTLWIRNFLGETGASCSFHYPISLQGGGCQRVRVGARTSVEAHGIIGCWETFGKDQHYDPEISIGEDCHIGEYCHITAIRRITIGNNLLTGRFVYIGDHAHGGLSLEDAAIPPIERRLQSKGEIVIGNNVWIGDKVTILSGVTIGDNAIIAAHAVVTKDIPANCIAAGVPARVVKS
ncbi:MAG: acyltransferase [Prevotella sp.]|nr:acyltransferase [Prevotella sp.]